MLSYKNGIILGASGNLGEKITMMISKKFPSVENLIITGQHPRKINNCTEKITLQNKKINIFPFTADFNNNETFDEFRIFISDLSFLPDFLIVTMGNHIKSSYLDKNTIESSVSVNLIQPLKYSLYILNLMKEGIVLFFSDAAITNPMIGYEAYYAAKSGLETAALSLALQYAPHIRINVIAPGIMNLKKSAKPDAELRLGKKIPLNFIGGDEPILSTVEFIMKNNYISNCVIPVDGGLGFRH